ncbi:hypothetical protein [Paraburkholderia sp. DGU8]|uniref:hypothetical protein n=1 Tax=Paraburkholderia sp. DGU8 TaxID=3161997 RepID=UPI003467780A
MSLHAAAWQIIGTSATAIVGVGASLYIATKNRSQLIRHGKETLDVQRLATARSASTFIAEKRQKWIDDLRTDLSHYLALTTELTEGWKRLLFKMAEEWDEHPGADPLDVLRHNSDMRETFLTSISARDGEHYQLLMRVMLRLNPDEGLHTMVLVAIFNLRRHLADLAVQAIKDSYDNRAIYDSIKGELDSASSFAKLILKEEWKKLKYEIADPDSLLRDILERREVDDIKIGKVVKFDIEHLSPLSTHEAVAPHNMNRAFRDDGPVAS